MEKIIVLIITTLMLFPLIAMAYPPTPVIDGIFTGFDPNDTDPFNEYAAAACDPSIGGERGQYGYFYQQNDGETLYIMNDFYCDTTDDKGGDYLDYNEFDFDLDNDEYFEYVLLVYADGDTRLLINGTPIDPADYGTYGVAGAVGWGVSPKEPNVEHRMYEISINHAGIDNEIGVDPFDPKNSVPPPSDRNKPLIDSRFIQIWGGTVRPNVSGKPLTLSTLIELDHFTAVPQNNQITITWNTLSEIDNTGFNLWRSESKNGNYIKINPKIIEAKGGATLNAEYSYPDNRAKIGVTYYYKLEDIDTRGVSTFHEPVSATIPLGKPNYYYPPYWVEWYPAWPLVYDMNKPNYYYPPYWVEWYPAWPLVYDMNYSPWWPYYPYP